MLRKATAADAEGIFGLLVSACNEIPLKIELERKAEWLDLIRSWCMLDHSSVVDPNGEVVSVTLVGARMQSTAKFFRENGEPPSEWELLYCTTREASRGNGLCKALIKIAVELRGALRNNLRTGQTGKQIEHGGEVTTMGFCRGS